MTVPNPTRPRAAVALRLPAAPTVADRLPGLRSLLRLPPEVFAALVEPLIGGIAEHQARSAHGPVATDGGADDPLTPLLLFTLRALAVRHERILPPNAAPETVGDLAHRWTYAVLVAGVLCHEHARGLDLPARMFDLVVPELGCRWLVEDPAVNAALMDVLAGRARVGNPIEAILRVAASGSSPCRLSPGSSEERAVDPCAARSQAPTKTVSSTAETAAAAVGGASVEEPAVSDTRASEFIAWLRKGLAKRSIEVNAWAGLVHRVPEGLLLVWPGLFRSFLDAPSAQPVTARALKRLRQSLFEAGWHLQGKGGIVVHEYVWRRDGSVVEQVSGVVVTVAERLMAPVPPVHPELERIIATADAAP